VGSGFKKLFKFYSLEMLW